MIAALPGDAIAALLRREMRIARRWCCARDVTVLLGVRNSGKSTAGQAGSDAGGATVATFQQAWALMIRIGSALAALGLGRVHARHIESSADLLGAVLQATDDRDSRLGGGLLERGEVELVLVGVGLGE